MDLTEKKLAISVLGLAVVISTLIQAIVPVRIDAFTGAEGAALVRSVEELKEGEKQRNEEIKALRQAIHSLEILLARGFAEPNNIQNRISALEATAMMNEEILRQQREILRQIQETLNEERNTN